MVILVLPSPTALVSYPPTTETSHPAQKGGKEPEASHHPPLPIAWSLLCLTVLRSCGVVL